MSSTTGAAETPVARGHREVLARRFLTTDAARPDKVARRHAQGRRTARENLEDLVDAGSFVEYGRFVTAAQEQRRAIADLVLETPADGIIGGTATIGGRPCAVLSYDYLVMAGTQGMRGHHKSDRLLELVERMRLPVIFFTEGGGGRPGDTDIPLVSALDTRSFAFWGRLDGVVPRIAIVSGRCFAGNAVFAGGADLRIATRDANLGMGGPAMIAGGGLGTFAPEEIGPAEVQFANGVLDVLVDDEADAVFVAQHVLGLLHGDVVPAEVADQETLRHLLPENEKEVFDVLGLVETACDTGATVWLRGGWAPELATGMSRIDGLPVGVIANDSRHVAGALTADASTKAADFLRLCERMRLPVVSFVDTPGFMVGPEAEETGLVRAAGAFVAAGARLTVPLIGVVLRRAYGLGAQAMLGGSTHEPLLTVAWPNAHLGPMGMEGAVRLAMAKELAAMEPEERERTVAETVRGIRGQADALNVARMFEIDDVIDPVETRQVVVSTIRASSAAPRSRTPGPDPSSGC